MKTCTKSKINAFVVLLLVTVGGAFSQGVYINEILASNSNVYQDPDFNASADWIELYNSNDADVELDGFYISDDDENLETWQIPGGVLIRGHGYLLIWADGQAGAFKALHSNFKLAKEGEFLGLSNAGGTLIDSVRYPQQVTDISFGRSQDGADEWRFFQQPSPAKANSGQSYQKVASPKFSLSAGFYSTPQKLFLSVNDPDAVIRYTLDCDDPSESSRIFKEPIELKSRAGDANFFSEIRTTADPEPWLPDWVLPEGEVFKATVVRARAFRPGYQPSDIITHSYFVDPDIQSRYPTIAVISLVSDYKNLFDEATGIYVPGNTHQNGQTRSGNYFQNWERPAHIELFEPGGDEGFAQNIGIKIQGGTSPASAQKGLHVMARNQYGSNRIEYPIFANTRFKARELSEFKRFMIRAWGSTINAALFNDAYAQSLVADTDLDLNAYRPAVLFINGEYWGLHEIREANKNSWYYQFHYGIDRDNPGFDILGHGYGIDSPLVYVDEGDTQHWNAMMQFMESHDMSLKQNYEYVKTQIDVENFIEYIGHCVYLCNWDWPNNNEGSWRPRTPDGRWRKILYDMETSFGVAEALDPIYANLGASFNMINSVLYGAPIIGFGTYGPQPVLVKLVQNDEFKNAFAKWFYDAMKNRYQPERMIALLDEMAAEIEPYLPEYRRRWPFKVQMNNDWHYHLDLIRDFARERPAYMRQHLINEFGAQAAVAESESAKPDEFLLLQNAPNPFNSRTLFEFYVPSAGTVRLEVFDVTGRQVAVLIDSHNAAGRHSVQWDAGDLASGVYFAKMQFDGKTRVRKVLLAQ